ncbi:MAG TPA: MoxR family ATPase [Steroidobacteraceae bacterium]|jgi:MoxR-like ATPase
MTKALEDLEQRLQGALGGTVIGMQEVIRALTIAIVARGHVLIQGAPGLGKTLLSKTLASALGGSFKRIQGTADLMPSDIIGVHIFDTPRNGFVFRPGPLFADVLLFDEINRAGPKTQSALLEAMEERQVSVDRHNYKLPAGFLVVATQNPRDFEGTYPLPESQLDRFMLRIDLSYRSREDELKVLKRYGALAPDARSATAASVAAVVDAELLAAARAGADAVHVAEQLEGYVLDLAKASREHTQLTLGLSTRGALALLRAARVAAGLRGKEFVTPDDVKAVAPLVLPHRLMLSSEAVLEGSSERSITQRLLEQVPVPR